MKAAALLVLLVITAVPAARACRYCQQAADPVEVLRFQGQGRNAGSFPLDDSLNNLGGGAPAAPVAVAAPTTAPDPATLVTSAAALPARPVVVAAVVSPKPIVVKAAPRSQPFSAHWADFGLLGLVGAGGLFAWRTRAARPVVA